ncbi:hypothetical protein DS421_2g48640 [Arachis hypogaea]|nr:hypothetical protein DS421_2g48640 [Arachis hypogaea]
MLDKDQLGALGYDRSIFEAWKVEKVFSNNIGFEEVSPSLDDCTFLQGLTILPLWREKRRKIGKTTMPAPTPFTSASAMIRRRLLQSTRTRGGASSGPSRWTSPGHEETPKGLLFNRTPPPRVSPASGRIGSFLATSPASSPSSSSASGSTPSPTSPSRPGPTRRPSSASRWRTASPPQPEQQPPLPTTITTTAITAITLKMCPTLSLDPITVDSDRTLIATGSSDGRRVKMNDSGHGTITSSTKWSIYRYSVPSHSSLDCVHVVTSGLDCVHFVGGSILLISSMSISSRLLAWHGHLVEDVCTAASKDAHEGHVKVYRPPFCDFCSEWIEVVNVSERLFEYLQCTEFQGTGTPLEFSKRNASDEIDSVAKPKKKSLKTVPENDMLPVISADQYATRSAVLSSIVVSWSPLLHDIHATVSLLAVGGKSGKISLWRFYAPDCYTIEGGKIPSAVKFVGFLEAHNSWVTTISWLSFSVNSSNPQILLVTGSSDGSVKVWLGDYHKLIKSTEVDQNVFILLKEVITVNVVPVSVLSVTVHVQCSSKMLSAIGKGSGSFEIWLCDISSKEFNKLGSYDAHDYIVTGLAWAFGGRCLYSCSQREGH